MEHFGARLAKGEDVSEGLAIWIVAFASVGLFAVLIGWVCVTVGNAAAARAAGSRMGVRETVVPVVRQEPGPGGPDLAEVLNDAEL